ncbi:hypothetical protein BGZ65_009515, partial [Modicella reniformis]
MEATQSFRLIGKSDTHEITCHPVDGTNIVLWEDIEWAFPGIKYVQHSGVIISFLKDPDLK